MGAALGGGDEVYIALLHQLTTFGQPLYRPVYGGVFGGEVADKGRGGAILQSPGCWRPGNLSGRLRNTNRLYRQWPHLKAHPQAGTQNSFGAQHMAHTETENLAVSKYCGSGKTHGGAGLAFGAGIDYVQIFGFIAISKADAVHLAIAFDGDFQNFGEGVHHGNTHTV